MKSVIGWLLSAALAASCFGLISPVLADEDLPDMRVPLEPKMMVNESDTGNPAALVDEQAQTAGAPAGNPSGRWEIDTAQAKKYPFSSYLDLGAERNLSKLWVYDVEGTGKLVISVGTPGDWKELLTYDCAQTMKWVPLTVDVSTRYIRFTRMEAGAQISEIAIYEYTPKEYQAILAKKAAEAKADAQRQADRARAQAELAKRPLALVDAGEPFGKLQLVDEVDCAAPQAGHDFVEYPAGASKVETLLGKPCRVLNKTVDSSAFFSYRLGKLKLLNPGSAYVLEVVYPEDAPRAWNVMNGGSETSRGFHTGPTLGDAMHPKYVNNYNESINTPLSGKFESWKTLFNLHDRTPNLKFTRGDEVRELKADDGFVVTIAQFSLKNIPMSSGAAVSKIRLYSVPDPSKFDAQYTLPPKELPHRRLFWREEMADGVIGSEKEENRGVKNPLDWWQYKANTMKFLGMNTYTKDLLEFGACQHWDPTPSGGSDWVNFNAFRKDMWAGIVQIMGQAGFEILPYYEYSGSKGPKGLGLQRRAKPLSRDDAYTHVKWVESANADITDPDTYEDFAKMLDATVIRFKDKANFAGIWIRPRGQLPMGFGDATRDRFAKEANGGVAVTRKQLIADKDLLEKYENWWYGKRKQFLVAMRDYLRKNGVNDHAEVLYTAVGREAGVAFNIKPTSKIPMVVDDVPTWQKIVAQPEYLLSEKDKPISLISVQEVVQRHLYLDALLAPPSTFSGWEWQYSNPPSDPAIYKDTDGVMFTETFNRQYTVADPKTFDAFREPSGLTIVRHYSLNENMMYDKDDKPVLGYFVADVERAGPFCMMAEAYAMANGDPTQIGYLVGQTFTRGFPQYARNFNTAFLSLPALPSKVVPNAANDKEVVVRSIATDKFGTYLSVVNLGMTGKDVSIRLPVAGKVTDAATGTPIEAPGGVVKLSLYPCQLRALRVQ